MWGFTQQTYKRYKCICRVDTLLGEQTKTIYITSNKGVNEKKLAIELQKCFPKTKYGRITQHKVIVLQSEEINF